MGIDPFVTTFNTLKTEYHNDPNSRIRYRKITGQLRVHLPFEFGTAAVLEFHRRLGTVTEEHRRQMDGNYARNQGARAEQGIRDE